MGFRGKYKNKRDANEPNIIKVFEDEGFDVHTADQPTDLILGYQGSTFLVEVKNGTKAPLTDTQKAFFGKWRGQSAIVCSVAEALEFAAAVKAGSV